MSHSRCFAGRLVCAGALVATAASLARGDQSSPTMVVYAPDSSLIAHYRLWNGSSWGTAANMPAVTGYPYWMVARNCSARNETACVMLDHNLDLHVTFFNGTSWSTPGLLCQKTGGASTRRPFDMVYENGGDLLIAYYDMGDNLGDDDDGDDDDDDDGGEHKGWRFRTYTGAAVSSEQVLALPADKDGRWVRLVPQPASNRILLLASDSKKDLHAAVWTGSSFTGATTLETNLSEKDLECWSAAYEPQSRDGLIAYTEGDSTTVRYRTLDDTTIGSEQSGPTMGTSKLKWLHAVSRAGTDGVMLVALNASKELYAAYWNGTSWGASTLIASSLQSNDRDNFSVAFQPDGAKCLVIHSANGVGTVKHRVWDGTSWGSSLSGSNGGSTNAVFALFPTSGAEVFGMIYATDNDLMSVRWSGSSLSAHTDLNGTIEGGQKSQCFMVVSAAVAEEPEEEGTPPVKKVVEWRETDPR